MPTPGGPTKHRIGLLLVAAQLAHGDVLEDALLRLLETVVVFVEHAPHLGDVEAIGRSARFHGRSRDPLDVVERDLVLGAGRVHRAHARQLAARGLHRLGRRLGLRQPLAQLFELLVFVAALAELAADRAQLLAQEQLALRLASSPAATMSATSFLTRWISDWRLSCSSTARRRARSSSVSRISCFLSAVIGRCEAIRSHSAPGSCTLSSTTFTSRGGCGSVRISVRAALAQVRGQRVDLLVAMRLFVQALARVRAGTARARPPRASHPRDALQHDAVVAGAQADHLEHACERSDREQIFEVRIFVLRLALRDHADRRAIDAESFFDQAHRARSADVDGHDRRWEQHRVAKRQHGNHSSVLSGMMDSPMRLHYRRFQGLAKAFVIRNPVRSGTLLFRGQCRTSCSKSFDP